MSKSQKMRRLGSTHHDGGLQPPLMTSEPSSFARFLVILKGDVSYRRLLDDRHWPRTARLEGAADYFPLPFLVLRTLKGETMVGLKPGQAEAQAAEDLTWLVNGNAGSSSPWPRG